MHTSKPALSRAGFFLEHSQTVALIAEAKYAAIGG
jgi:hypothetical protein